MILKVIECAIAAVFTAVLGVLLYLSTKGGD